MSSKFQRKAYGLMAEALLGKLQSGAVSTYGDQEGLTQAEVDEIVETIFTEVQRFRQKSMTLKERREKDMTMVNENLPIIVSQQTWTMGVVWCNSCGRVETPTDTIQLFVIKFGDNAGQSKAVFYCQQCAAYVAQVLTGAWDTKEETLKGEELK